MTAAGAELIVLGRAQHEIDRPLSAVEIRAGVNLIQEVMKSVMKKDVHYGTIPGTPKPTLYKPGAEKILSTFRIAIDPIVEDLSTDDEARYRVTARATAQATGTALGSGVGECSSNEEKYRWRASIHPKEWAATPEDRRRVKYKADGKEIQQVRTNHADIANTVLKMATKRAMIAVTLTVTAASDIFAQDIEDLPPEIAAEIAQQDGASVEAPHFREPQPVTSQPAQADESTPGIRVTSCKVAKTGTKKDGGEWKLHIVGLSDGNEYTTFSETLYADAKALLASKSPVTFEFEQTEKGRNLILLEAVR